MQQQAKTDPTNDKRRHKHTVKSDSAGPSAFSGFGSQQNVKSEAWIKHRTLQFAWSRYSTTERGTRRCYAAANNQLDGETE